MRIYGIAALALVGGLALAACGSSGSSTSQSASPVASQGTNSDAPIAVNTGDTALGKVLTSADGHTLYGFMQDTKTTSACNDACASTWPPVIVGAHWGVGSGLDHSAFSVIVRKDGQRQLVAGVWPLYTFSGDPKAGDTNGEGIKGMWFAVGSDNKLVKAGPSTATTAPATNGYGYGPSTPTTAPAPTAPTAAAAVTTGMTTLGNVLVDANGHTIYGLTKDDAGTSTCVGACEQAWPPVHVSSSKLPSGLDATLFSVIKRADGTWQLKAGKWPLYTFAGDSLPGDVNGQGSGGTWYAVSPDGKLHT